MTISATGSRIYPTSLHFPDMENQRLADQGDPKAQFNLGLLYEHETGVEKNIEEAIKWYTRSADQGNSKARNNLGVIYWEDGHADGKENIKEAIRLLRLAAEDQEDPKAQFNLGLLYNFGSVSRTGCATFYKWLLRSEEFAYSSARSDFGVICHDGRYYLKPDSINSYRLLKLAADQGHSGAQRAVTGHRIFEPMRWLFSTFRVGQFPGVSQSIEAVGYLADYFEGGETKISLESYWDLL